MVCFVEVLSVDDDALPTTVGVLPSASAVVGAAAVSASIVGSESSRALMVSGLLDVAVAYSTRAMPHRVCAKIATDM
eukprot:8168277-Karenia_brevis.AAC.1